MSSSDHCQPLIFLHSDNHPHKDHRIRSPSPLAGGMNNLNIYPIQRKRASSFKKPKEKNIDNFLTDEMRPRTSSMPTRNTFLKPHQHRAHMGLNIDSDIETYTVRSFKMNSKGVIVNRGDSMRSRSTNSVFSSEGELCQLSPSSRTSSSISRESVVVTPGPVVSVSDAVPTKVLVVGAPGVGKSALTQQFMTSEYLGGFDTSIDADATRSVNVLLNGEETALSFMAAADLEDEELFDDVTAYVIVYACDDKESFQQAVDTLFYLRKGQHSEDAIILVGNKSDLVRSKCVPTEEAKSVAQTYDCKFVETSVVLNMNVDELLVGIVRQIRLKQSEDISCQGCASTGKHMLNKLFKPKTSISKSCENLYK